ncbi:MAG: DUF4278 domain-containing protein [Microcoleus sp. PH2017_01_SCD_O_A]|uniref:DUF4278 domain-containing protein n=1 Tax=unclassified Microcoleus TaxID=2642155 RepID=UPI001D25D8EA|nr:MULTISPECIES: DUF4278 domain-containing protein [unclassified Microcoleus]MCC3419093.1 DUF4278 domain-containing protein [Microcoleus sp. PH2017_07_MST_O_A]MCC3467299.1 DUF4278 domain-containing protein [Microcoleus sp. PH2017_06_SFM_O_A]MCC3509638.1 DUF4278 domain-containing protein [Microcoleus sp. PH2017_17_BER_D_A]TAE10553.1 MAG: DUF4278 domain-containing protein [Oscillatoriales cyanobacterium]MCC3425472.1 DUF4278 domain-containing protein [Microcoleus sp. PH2017_01_SCD_O_A]
MKLTYRGANYEYDIPTVDMIEGEVAGKYRGQDWNYRYPRHLAVPKKYGGINSTTKRDFQAQQQVTTPCAAVESAPTAADLAQVHRSHICSILDRRKQVATAKGDERLLRLLEREWQQMAC